MGCKITSNTFSHTTRSQKCNKLSAHITVSNFLISISIVLFYRSIQIKHQAMQHALNTLVICSCIGWGSQESIQKGHRLSCEHEVLGSWGPHQNKLYGYRIVA